MTTHLLSFEKKNAEYRRPIQETIQTAKLPMFLLKPAPRSFQSCCITNIYSKNVEPWSFWRFCDLMKRLLLGT